MSEINYFDNSTDWGNYSATTAYTSANFSQVTYTSYNDSIIYKGVNVIVNVPKRGDAVYAKSDKTDKPVFFACETLKCGSNGLPLKTDGTEDSSYTRIGVVVNVRGKQILILHYTDSGSNKTWNAATLSGNVNTALQKYYDDIEDMNGNMGYRQTGNVNILFYNLTKGNWTTGSTAAAISTANGSDFCGYSAGNGPYTSTVQSALTAYYEPMVGSNAASTAGFMEYLRHRQRKTFSFKGAMGKAYGKAKEISKILSSYTDSTNTFLANTWAQSLNYQVDGLRIGEWYMPGLDEAIDLWQYVIADPITKDISNDPIAKTLVCMKGTTAIISLNNSYWLGVPRSSANAWYIGSGGNLDHNTVTNPNISAVAVSLLNL